MRSVFVLIERRGEVIKYVQDKYGHDKVAQIVTFGTLGAKAAIKDTGRVLEFPFAETNRLCKLVPPEIGGQGVAAALVNALVADAQREGFTIVPQCSYVEAQFKRHPEWSDLLAATPS